MEIGRRNIRSEDELDQIGKGEGSAGDSDRHYILGLPIERPMTLRRSMRRLIGLSPICVVCGYQASVWWTVH